VRRAGAAGHQLVTFLATGRHCATIH